MERIVSKPRHDWQTRVESQGLLFHTPDGECYWDESAFYRFTAAEVDAIERATYALNGMCLKAVEHVIEKNLFDRFQIPLWFAPFVTRSWDQDELTIYGRFDLAYDGTSPPKLVEYNADTPTSLLEASVIQWQWLKDTNSKLDQFNSIHERLIEAWGRVKERRDPTIYFTCAAGDIEDWMTLSYLRDTAMQAGLQTRQIDIDRLGFNHLIRQFVDEDESPVSDCFKLYPWEWLLREKFAPYLLESATRWLEAPWKMILSNKAILPVLWELFPGNPHLLPASFEPLAGAHVRKPYFGREGANIRMVDAAGATLASTEAESVGLPEVYNGPFVYQQLHPVQSFDRRYPVVGSWIVNGYACGMGIREDVTPLVRGTSHFVPHVMES